MTPFKEQEKILTRIKNSYDIKNELVRAEDLIQVINAQLFILNKLEYLVTKNLFK
jgi:hypothetical protein